MSEATTTAANAVEVLNRIHAADPKVLSALVSHRVFCNKAVADDPTVQVGRVQSACDGRTGTGEPVVMYEVGLLGIINGIFGIDDWTGYGYIAARLDDDQKLAGFELVDHGSLPPRPENRAPADKETP